MAPQSTLSSKGQITVLLEIRRRLGLKQGDRVEFVVQGDWTIIRPARPEKIPSKNMLARSRHSAPKMTDGIKRHQSVSL
jgi:AbrB family looped-hinge helix DNA binding protein